MMSPTISRKSSFTSTFPPSSPSPSSTFDTQPHTLPPRSRTSSTTSLTSIKHPLNPHPYAIKTTSSAVTSSSSPAHHQASYKHYVPPPSPSPTGGAPAGWRVRAGSFSSSSGGVYPTSAGGYSGNGVGGGGGNGGGSQGHRYSRSMTDAGPRALPIPPSMDRSASTSPTTGRTRSAFVEMEADAGYFGDVGSGSRGTMKSMNAASSRDKRDKGRTPRQSAIGGAPGMRRADTLPSEHSNSNSPFIFPVPHPSRTRAEALAFSSDEERDGDEEEEEEEGCELASNAYNHTRRSPMNSRVSRTAGNRVRGMVASFERSASSSSGSELDNDDYGSTTKPQYNTSGVGYNSNSNSPVKRTVYNRRSVADLFSSGSPAPAPAPVSNHTASQYATTSIPTTLSAEGGSDDFAHTTLKPSLPTRRTSKELPRLLPFPPPIAQTFFSTSPVGTSHTPLAPTHTGAGYPLPMSPEQTGGYHGPVAIQGTGGSGGGRLLPVPLDLVSSPPNDGQTLHHPRPVRGGPPELVQVDLGVRSEGEGNGREEEEEGEEEPSIEELLAREDAQKGGHGFAAELGLRRGTNGNGDGSGSNGAGVKKTGVGAWEVGEVGETVKRVPGGPRPLSSNRSSGYGGRRGSGEHGNGDGKRGSPLGGSDPSDGADTRSVDGGPGVRGEREDGGAQQGTQRKRGVPGSPISPTIAFTDLGNSGFVSGRRKARVRPKGSRSSLDSVGSIGSIGDKERRYEEAQVQTDAPSSSFSARTNDGSEATQHNDEDLEGKGREFDLEEKARSLDGREKELERLSLEIEETQRELESVRMGVDAMRVEVDAREEGVGVRELVVEAREKELGGRKGDLKAKARAIEEREEDLKQKVKEQTIEEREREIGEKELNLKARERELEVRAEGLKMSLEERAREVEGREVELGKREAELARREEEVGRREMEVGEREAKLSDREAELSEREAEIKARERELETKEVELETRSEALGQRETTVDLAALVRRVVGRVVGNLDSYGTQTSSSSPSSSALSSSSSSSSSSASSASKEPSPPSTVDRKRSAYPYMVVLGLGVCVVVVRVLVKGLGLGGGGRLGGVGGRK